MRRDRPLLGLALTSVVASLAIRILHRGVDVPGWDLLLTTEGQYLLATRGLWGALVETLAKVRTFWLPPSAYSIPYGLVPGALTLWRPGLFWQPLAVFLSWVTTLALLVVGAGWPVRSTRGWAVALLAWGASPALLSYAVEGYPWGTCMLPHAVVVAMTLCEPPLAWSWTLGALALAWELPWHGYEVGKTVGLTLILCAIFAPRGDALRRFAWLAVGGAQIAAVWWVWPSGNLVVLGNGSGTGAGLGLLHAWSLLPEGLGRLGAAFSGTSPLVFPILVVTGGLALWWARPVAAPWGAQLGLVLLLASAGPGLLRARRFLVVEGFSIAAILYAVRTAPSRIRVALVVLLVAGNGWAIFDAVKFASAPKVDVTFSLPGVRSDEGVGLVDRPIVTWAEGLGRRAQAGERIIVLQGQACPSESHTNPVGVLERLYLRLGHEAFRDRVVGVATREARYVTVPVVDIRSVLDTVEAGAIVDLDATCFNAMADVWQQLTARFYLAPIGAPEGKRFIQFRLAPLSGT